MAPATSRSSLLNLSNNAAADTLFLFRFRCHPPSEWSERGCLVGWSGRFDLASPPSALSPGGTFSRFREWDSQTLEQHIAEIQGEKDGSPDEQDTSADGEDRSTG